MTYVIQKNTHKSIASTEHRKDNHPWELAFGIKPRSYPEATSPNEAIEKFKEEVKRVRTTPHRLVVLRGGGYGTHVEVLASINCTDS